MELLPIGLDTFIWLRSLFKVGWQTILLWLHTRLPHRREEIKSAMFAPYRRLGIKGLDEDQQLESFFTTSCVLERTRIMYVVDRGQQAQLGGDAFNSLVYRMDGSEAQLLDHARVGRPLVLNFGSCS